MRHFQLMVAVALLLVPASIRAQTAGRAQWVLEPNTQAVDNIPGRSYLDPASVHRGNDGLVYFTESTEVKRDQDIGKVGFMSDAYDCVRNIKYMCIDQGDWRNDPRSRIDTAKDPALPVYRKYLCGDGSGRSAR